MPRRLVAITAAAVIFAAGSVVLLDHRLGGVDPGRGRSSAKQVSTLDVTYDSRRIPIHLDYVKGLSGRFTSAAGRADLNFASGEIAVTVKGLDALPEGSAYEAWVVEHGPGSASSVGLDLDEGEDRIVNLGTLPAAGSQVFLVGPVVIASLDVDMMTVMHIDHEQVPEIILAGFQSVFFKRRQATLTPRRGAGSR